MKIIIDGRSVTIPSGAIENSNEAIFFINYVTELTKGKSYIFTMNDYVGTPVVGRIYVMFGGDGSRWAGGLGRVTEIDSASGNVTVESSYWDYLTVDAYTKQEIDDKIATIGSSVGGVPLGAIMIWSGSADDIPTGWALCDGQDGRYDLRDKFILAAGPNHPVGETGGSEEVALTLEQIPSHSHSILFSTQTSGNNTLSITGQLVDRKTTSGISEYVGSSQTHPNMPPYYALCYIVKIAPDETDGVTMDQVNEAIDSAIKPIQDKKADAIFETVGPASSTTFDIASEGSLLHPVSEIKLVQEGEGTPSLTNIRNISGWDSISLAHNGTVTTQSLPKTIYGGIYDWAKGELTVTHKFFALAVADMNNSETLPGWINSGIIECVKPGVTGGAPGLLCYNARICSVNSNIDIVFFSNSGMTQSEWKAQYPDLICQFIFPLLEPRTIQLTPHDFLALSGTNTLSSDCGDTTVTFSTDLERYIERNSTAIMSQVNEAIDIAINGAIEGAY